MYQNRWWEEDELVRPPTPAQPYGRVTTGNPDPRRAQDLQRGNIDLQRGQQQLGQGPDEAENIRLRNERQRQEIEEAARRAADPAGAAGIEQRRAAGFFNRALRSNGLYEEQGVGPRDPLSQSMVDMLPRNVTNPATSSERQRAEAAERDFIAATLRYESGAAIPEPELESQRRIFFPSPGDTPETIAQKAEMRRNAIEALRIGGGEAAEQPGREVFNESLGRLTNVVNRAATARSGSQARGGSQPNQPGMLDIGPIGVGIDPNTGQPPPPPPPPGLLRQFGDSALNVAAGVGQGMSAIPDAATNALSGVMAVGADAVGADWLADQWRHPVTIGGMIERAVPTPDTGIGQFNRFASQFAGGAASTPQRALNRMTENLVGRIPLRQPNLGPQISRANVAREARDANIPMLPADVGGPGIRALTAGVAQTPAGAGPIVRGGQNTISAAQRELGRIAGGRQAIPEAAGEIATRGALRYRDASRQTISGMYDRATQLAGDTLVPPQGAMTTLNRHIAELEQNPAADDALAYLTGLRDTIATRFPNGITVQGVRGMRTQLRDRFLREGLRGSDAERRAMEVVDAASEDVATALTNAGRGEAADLYRSADAAWRARAETIDNVLMPIIGRQGEKSGTQVFQALQNAARGNGPRLQQFIRALPEDEAETVRASLINALGRPTAGRQGAEGTNFSLNDFLTHWNQLAPTARNAMFTRPQRDGIERLSRIAENTKGASAYANSSRTGGVVATLATGASVVGGWPAVAATLAGQYVAGRLLASPKVAQVLAAVGSARGPQQAQAAIRRLSPLAARNPALANDISELQRRLLEAFAASPATRAAAYQDQQVR